MLMVVVELVARGSLGAPLEKIGRVMNPLNVNESWFTYGFSISPSLPVLEIFFEDLITKW